MCMRVARRSNELRGGKTGVCVLVKVERGTNIFATVVVLVVAITAMLMPASGRPQSGDDSKPPAPTQSSKQVLPPLQDAQTSSQPPQSVMRTVTVTFNYDFSQFPPCSATIAKKCIQQFNVYEVSGSKPVFLFSIPVPPGAKGKLNEITGSAPSKRAFFTGPHRFGVSAKMPGVNAESDPYQCMTFAQVLPDNPAPNAPSSAPSNSSPKK
jgi:hypothetical protein